MVCTILFSYCLYTPVHSSWKEGREKIKNTGMGHISKVQSYNSKSSDFIPQKNGESQGSPEEGFDTISTC